MQIQQQDGLYGISALTASGGGTAIQMVTEWASLGLIGLNILLAVAGLYLIYKQLKRKTP